MVLDKITWYSKLLTGIVFFAVAAIFFYLGVQYGSITTERDLLVTRFQDVPYSISSKSDFEVASVYNVNSELLLDFQSADTIGPEGPMIAPLVAGYAEKDGHKIRGREIRSLTDSFLDFKISSSSRSTFVSVSILSVGKYTQAEGYRGVGFPICGDFAQCGYGFGGLSSGEAEVVIIFQVTNSGDESMTIDLSRARLFSDLDGEVTFYNQRSSAPPASIFIEPFSSKRFTMNFFVPEMQSQFTFSSYRN